MTLYHLLSDVASDADLEAAFEWYESEQPGLGFEFLDEVRAVYDRILDGPFKYQQLRLGIRRALTRRSHMRFSLPSKMIASPSSRSSTPPATPLNGSRASSSQNGPGT